MKTLIFLLITFISLTAIRVDAQSISTFESFNLSVDTFYNVLSTPDTFVTFSDGEALFSSGAGFGFWLDGWSISSVTDKTTPGIGNVYGVITGSGYNGSRHFAVGQNNATIQLQPESQGKVISGFWATNSTYAALSMKNGDQFAKKFGGADGDDPDFFLLTIKAYRNGSIKSDSVDFYLADFRFPNQAQDYIVEDWRWVDLSNLGGVDSLIFQLTSSDTSFGFINTPAFFCIDHFTTQGFPLSTMGLDMQNNDWKIYPNPVQDVLNMRTLEPAKGFVQITVTNMLGQVVLSTISQGKDIISVPVADLQKGLYRITLQDQNHFSTSTFIRQ